MARSWGFAACMHDARVRRTRRGKHVGVVWRMAFGMDGEWLGLIRGGEEEICEAVSGDWGLEIGIVNECRRGLCDSVFHSMASKLH